MVAVRTSEGEERATRAWSTGWCEDGERVPEIKIRVSDIQREGSSQGDKEKVWRRVCHMNIPPMVLALLDDKQCKYHLLLEFFLDTLDQKKCCVASYSSVVYCTGDISIVELLFCRYLDSGVRQHCNT